MIHEEGVNGVPPGAEPLTLDRGQFMKAASKGAKTGQPKLFREWFAEWNAAEQNDFMKRLRWRARRLVGSDNAGDLTQETMAALWISSHPYPYIEIGLAFAKARELAPAYRRQPQGEFTDVDALVDPDDNPCEAMLKREAEREAKQAWKSSVERIRQELSPKQSEFLNFHPRVRTGVSPQIKKRDPFASAQSGSSLTTKISPGIAFRPKSPPRSAASSSASAEIRKIAEDDLTKELAAEAAQLEKRRDHIDGIIKDSVADLEAKEEAIKKRLYRRGISSSTDFKQQKGPRFGPADIPEATFERLIR